jgi:multisubunit Na+/H+ antiporter MnhF subunit
LHACGSALYIAGGTSITVICTSTSLLSDVRRHLLPGGEQQNKCLEFDRWILWFSTVCTAVIVLSFIAMVAAVYRVLSTDTSASRVFGAAVGIDAQMVKQLNVSIAVYAWWFPATEMLYLAATHSYVMFGALWFALRCKVTVKNQTPALVCS